MDDKYKLLSHVTPNKIINFKERFSKLTLLTKPDDQKSRHENKSRKSDRSLITDDESDTEPSETQKERIMNKILCSEEMERDSEKDEYIKETPDHDKSDNESLFSAKLQIIDTNETNCNISSSNSKLEIEMKKLEIIASCKSSDTLFSKSSEEQLSKNCFRRTSTADTVLSRLSTQLDRLGLEDNIRLSNLPDDEKIRNSLLSKTEKEKIDTSVITILSISSTEDNTDEESEGSDATESEDSFEEERVIVLSSSDEDDNRQVSTLADTIEGTLSPEARQRLSEFFNNIPTLSTPKDTENELVSDKTIENDDYIIPETPENLSLSENSGTVENIIPDIESPLKSESSIKIQNSNNENKISQSQNDSAATEIINISAKVHINIQISGIETPNSSKSSNTSNESESSLTKDDAEELNKSEKHSTDDSKKHQQSQNNIQSSLNSTNEEQKSKENMESDSIKSTNENEQNRFPGLQQEDLEIDEEMEELLNELYGEEWKTPQLLEKCSSTKKKKPKDRMDMTRYSIFNRKILPDLESTRVDLSNKNKEKLEKIRRSINFIKTNPGSVKESSTKKNILQEKQKHTNSKPTRRAAANKRYILSKSTSSEDDSVSSDDHNDNDDVSFRAEAVHISSSSSEEEIIKPPRKQKRDKKTTFKQQKSRRQSRILYGMESVITYQSDDDESSGSEAKEENIVNDKPNLDKILDSCEYKKKPSISVTPTPVTPTNSGVPSRRRLFTPNYDDFQLPEANEDKPKPTNLFENDQQQISFKTPWIPTIVHKKITTLKNSEIKSIPSSSKDTLQDSPEKTSKKSKPTAKCTTIKSKKVTTDELVTVPIRTYGFLQSLEEKLPESFCDPEAVNYRKKFSKMKVELGERLFSLYNEYIFKFEKDTTIPLSWNKKLTNTAGRCFTSKKTGVRKCRIEFSDKVVTTAERLRCTLIHEMCHAATWIYDGLNGHGSIWKTWASKCTIVFPELPPIKICHAYDIEYKYTYKCAQCNMKSYAHSKSKKTDKIRCAYCHGEIEIFLNKKNKDGINELTPTRTATGFAKYVKENYKNFKVKGRSHVDVMRILGSEFKSLSVSEKEKY